MREFFAAVVLCLTVALVSVLMFPMRAPTFQARAIAAELTPKFQDRVPSAPIVPRPVTVERIEKQVASVNIVHERTSLPWSCDAIRAATANLTNEQIERLGRTYRLTDRQKAEARACLRKRT